jgi:streptogramin lyase
MRRTPRLESLEGRVLLTSITEIATPNTNSLDIATGSDGYLWFTEIQSNAVGRLNPANHSITNYSKGIAAGSVLGGIASGGNGKIYFAESVANAIGAFDTSLPNNQTVQLFNSSNGMTRSSGPGGITASGGFLWFTQTISNQIGQLNPVSGHITEISSTSANPFNITGFQSQITSDASGKLWFTEPGGVASLDPATGKVTQVSLSPSSQTPLGIALGPDANIWITSLLAAGSSAIEVISPATSSVVKVISLPSGSSAYGIAAGPDNNIWYTDSGTASIGMVNVNLTDPSQDTLGSSIVIPKQGQVGGVLPTPAPQRITGGADGNVWFTDGNGAVGVVNLNVQPHLVVTAPPSGVTAGQGFGFTVTAEYGSHIVDTLYNGNETVSLASIPSGGSSTLGGANLTVSAVNGVATFSGLTLEKAAAGYTLRATSSGTGAPASVTTNAFNVVAAAATKLVVTSQPPGSVATPFGFTVAAEDQFNNVDTNFSGTVTITLPNPNPGGAGTILGGTTSLAISPASATPGFVTFSGLSINNVGTGYKLGVSSNPVLSATTTNPFDVTAPITPPPPPAPPPPTIIGESVVINQKFNKKHKPVGKATLSGYTITFSTAMDQSSLANRANYLVAQKVIKNQRVKVGKKTVTRKVTVLQPIGFSVSQVTSNSVTLKLAGNQKFPKGGQITVIAAAPSGVDNTSHVFLARNGILSIAAAGKRISLVQT